MGCPLVIIVDVGHHSFCQPVRKVSKIAQPEKRWDLAGEWREQRV
jgi:hypothetical protein